MSLDVAHYLRRELAAGRMVLFTGAGFSSLARDAGGERRVPTGAQLAGELWELCFPGERRDDSSLQDLYQHALRSHPRELRALLDRRLHVAARLLPRFYSHWLAMPWRRIYTLNVDDLPTVAARRFGGTRRLRTFSALRDGVEDAMLQVGAEELDVIHLNGIIDDGPERITFSTVQYAGRLAQHCPFYSQLVRDFAEYPVLFVGTRLDETPLWQHLEIEGVRESLRDSPPAVLVTQRVTRARQSLLESLKIHWLPMDVRAFARDVLAHVGTDVIEAGLEALDRNRTRHPPSATTGADERERSENDAAAG